MKTFLIPSFCKKSVLSSLILPLISLMLTWGIAIAPAQATGVYDLPTLTAGSSTYLIDQAEAISRVN